MSVLDFPNITVSSVVWKLRSRTQVFTSPLVGTTQTLELPGSRWAAEIAFPILKADEKRALSAFLVQLRGRAGRFYLSDLSNRGPAGSVLGTPVVDLSVSNTSVLIGSSGWTANSSGVLLAGDMIGFSTGELKMVVADVDSDSSGQAIIQVEPPCRTQPGDATPIVTSSPTCVMRLSDDDQASWKASPPLLYEFSISCEEAIV